MKKMTIGILGGLINNINLGCVALTYSLINILEEISRKNRVKYEYIIFDLNPSDESVKLLKEKLNITYNKIKCCKMGEIAFNSPKSIIRILKKSKVNINMLKNLNNCDIVIDITQGDSFTDLYGEKRFYVLTTLKKIVEMKKIPLVLAPQTYGPFDNSKCKKYAKTVIEKADLVMSRDEESAEYVKSFCDKNVVSVTDLAFGLPYKYTMNNGNGKIKVGINPSGLLSKKRIEGTSLNSHINVDFDYFIRRIIEELTKTDKYEVHLISHVGDEAQIAFPNLKNVIYHSPFETPIDAKGFISGLDVFIGARMHATIASFSAGVATIPLAYSKKFEGLFGALGYDEVVDLRKLDNEEAVNLVMEYISNYKELQKGVLEAKKMIDIKYKILCDTIEKHLISEAINL